MRKSLMILLAAGAVAASACEADRDTFERTDATLAPPPEVEAAREHPVNPTGESLQDDANDIIATDTLQDLNIRADSVR